MSYQSTKYTGVQFRLNKNNEKIFYVRYKVNGKLVRVKVGSDKEGINATYCNKHRAKLISELRLGADAPMMQKEDSKRIANLTVSDGARLYLDSIKGLSDTRNNLGRYDNHLRREFGNKLLTEVTEDDVKRFVEKKQKEVSFKTGRPYASKTINDMVDLLNTIYKFIIDKEDLKITSPASNKTKLSSKGVKRLDVDNARQRYLSLDEIQLLYDTVDNRVARDNSRSVELSEDLKIFVRLSLCTGARLSSVLNIKKQDINIDNKSVVIKDLKNKSTYTGYLSATALEAIRERYNRLKPNEHIIGGKVTPKHRIPISKALQPILNELFNQGLDVDDAQNRVVIHTLRHTFGSQLAINNTPIFTIQKLMNHKSIEMTMRYAKLAPEQGKDAVLSIF
jgi:integrase